MKYVLFGAGGNGKEAFNFIDKKEIAYFIDNDIKKAGTDVSGIPVYFYPEKQQELSRYRVIITALEPYSSQMADQLRQNGILKFDLLKNMQVKKIREKLNSRLDYVQLYKKEINRISQNVVNKAGYFLDRGG